MIKSSTFFSTICATATMAFLFSSCAQEVNPPSTEIAKEKNNVVENTEDPYSEPHQYGGWYCPDNFGFEPVDIKNLQLIPVVNGRMPQKWETRAGLSLMYLDPEKFPEAKALEIELPALAYVDHPYADFKELAIIIQAFIADKDTIVGYRFPNGGNGSAWFGQVDFLTKEEVNTLEGTSFVYEKVTIPASKRDIWNAFTKSNFAKDLSKQFQEKKMIKSDWSDGLDIDLRYNKGNEMGRGYVMNLYGNLYMQIDFVAHDRHSSYKFMVSEDLEAGTSTVTFVAGPYINDMEAEQKRWKTFLEQLKEDSGC